MSRPKPGIMVRIRGIIPKWPYFRLVKYYNSLTWIGFRENLTYIKVHGYIQLETMAFTIKLDQSHDAKNGVDLPVLLLAIFH